MDHLHLCVRLNIHSPALHGPEQPVWTPPGGDAGRPAGQRGHGDSRLLAEGLPHVHRHRRRLWPGVLLQLSADGHHPLTVLRQETLRGHGGCFYGRVFRHVCFRTSHHSPEGDGGLEVQHALRGAPATQPRGLRRAAQTHRHRRRTGDPQDPRPRAPEGSAVHAGERENPHLHRLHRLRSRANYLTEERAWPPGRGGARGRAAGPGPARPPAAGLLRADREELHLLHALRALRDAGLLRPVPVHHPAGAQPRPGPRPRGPAAVRHGRGRGVRPHWSGAGPQPGAHPQGLHRAHLCHPADPVPVHLHLRHGLLGPHGLQCLLRGHDRDRGGHPHPAARRGRRRGHPEDVVGGRSLRLLPEHLGAGRTPPCRSAGGPEQDLQQSLLLLCGRDAGGRRVPRPRETLQAGTVLPAPNPGGQGRGSPREKSVAGHTRRLSGDGPGEDRAQSSCKNGARLTPASITAAPRGRGGRGAGGLGGRAADHPPAFRLHFKGNVCENHYQHPSCFLLISFLFCLFFTPKQKQWSSFLCISLAGFSSNTKTGRRTLGHIPVLK